MQFHLNGFQSGDPRKCKIAAERLVATTDVMSLLLAAALLA